MPIANVWSKVGVYAFAATLVLLPLTQTVLPPLVDLPNHLAKVYLAQNLPDAPHLSQFYAYQWHIVPNLAQDIFGPTLSKIFGVYDGGRAFLVWSLLQIVFGVCLLRYAVHGSVGWWPLGSFVILYNQSVSWGFLNYLFSSGLALIFFAVWILLSHRGAVTRAALFSVIFAAMFFLHLVGTAILCLCIGAYQLQRLWTLWRSPANPGEKRRACGVELIVPGIPFLVAFLLWLASPSGAGEVLYFHGGFPNLHEAVLSPFLMNGTRWDYSLALAVFMTGGILFATGQMAVAKPVLLPSLALLIIALVMPSSVLGAIGMNVRIPFVLGCVVLAGVQVKIRYSAFFGVAFGIIGILFTIRLASITQEWRQFDVGLGQFRQAIAQIEPGSKVLTAIDSYERKDWRQSAVRPEIYFHLSALVVIEASAFDPLLFSDPRHTNVTVRKRFAHIDALLGIPAITKALNSVAASGADSATRRRRNGKERRVGDYWLNWPRDFDYLIRYSMLERRVEITGPVERVASGDWFDLYKIKELPNNGAPH